MKFGDVYLDNVNSLCIQGGKPDGAVSRAEFVCFFTDDSVIDPIDGKEYGDTFWGHDGFESGNIRDIKKEKGACKSEG